MPTLKNDIAYYYGARVVTSEVLGLAPDPALGPML
jgi:glutamate formiminotransferase